MPNTEMNLKAVCDELLILTRPGEEVTHEYVPIEGDPDNPHAELTIVLQTPLFLRIDRETRDALMEVLLTYDVETLKKLRTATELLRDSAHADNNPLLFARLNNIVMAIPFAIIMLLQRNENPGDSAGTS